MKLRHNLGSLVLIGSGFLMCSLAYGQVDMGRYVLDCSHWGKRAEFISNNVGARRSVGAENPVADEKRSMNFDELEPGSVGLKYYSIIFEAIESGVSTEEVNRVADAFCREFPAGTFDPDS